MNDVTTQPKAKRSRDVAVAAACGVFVALMVGLAYAAVPLYSWFCRATGFGGTPQISTVAPAGVIDRKITVRFDSNVGPGLPWKFTPEVTSVDLKIGEVATIYYDVVNESARVTEGQAAYNVAPPTVGEYFTKINCFCFTQQRMAPGEKRRMAVVFYVDPALAKDADDDDLNTITLSYTFYPVPVEPERPAGSSATKPQSSRAEQGVTKTALLPPQ
jgi:cytochrome c oxidase assembly protein subunit 11